MTKNSQMTGDCLSASISFEAYSAKLKDLEDRTQESNFSAAREYLESFIEKYIPNTLAELVEMYPHPSKKVADLAKYYMKFHCNAQSPDLLEFLKSYSRKKLREAVTKSAQAYQTSILRMGRQRIVLLPRGTEGRRVAECR